MRCALHLVCVTSQGLSMGLVTPENCPSEQEEAHWNCIIILIRTNYSLDSRGRPGLILQVCRGRESKLQGERELFLEIYVSGTHLKPLPAIKVLILLCTLHPILLVQPPPCWAGWRSLVGKRHSICSPPIQAKLSNDGSPPLQFQEVKGGTGPGLSRGLKAVEGGIGKEYKIPSIHILCKSTHKISYIMNE